MTITAAILIGFIAAWAMYGVVQIAPDVVMEPDKKITLSPWSKLPVVRGFKNASDRSGLILDFSIIAISLVVINIHGLTAKSIAWLLFSWTLIGLAAIDFKTKLLPDFLTLPLVWAGLLVSYYGLIGIQLEDSLLGAVIGYMSLYTFYWIIKIATGVEGLGYGDFKLLAAIGAWHGLDSILYVVVVSSLIGAVWGGLQKVNKVESEDGTIPFGPFIVTAAFLYSTGLFAEFFKI